MIELVVMKSTLFGLQQIINTFGQNQRHSGLHRPEMGLLSDSLLEDWKEIKNKNKDSILHM